MTRHPLLLRVADWGDRNTVFITVLLLVAAVGLLRIPAQLKEDSWLALVAGREVAARGIPEYDRLAVITRGARWVDQQWLSQLTMYELHQIGGLALLSIVYVGLTMAALALGVAAARHLGASDRHIVYVSLVPAALFLVASDEIRTQGFAYPLFVGVLWLMAAESRSAGRRGYMLFPVLVIWANLHGSVVLGAAIGVIHGLSLLAGARSASLPGSPMWTRPTLFIVGSPLCVLATPYGAASISYYRDTLLNPRFRGVISEWAPVTSVPALAVPFLLMCIAAVWLLGRNRKSRPLFDLLILYMVIFNGISAVRNVTWFALAAIVLLSGLLSDEAGRADPAPRQQRMGLNLTITGLGAAFLLGALIVVATKPRTWFEQNYDEQAAMVVQRAVSVDPSLRVYSVGRRADWLMWRVPDVVSRVAYDSRVELLTDEQLRRLINLVNQSGRRYADVIDSYGLLVLDPQREASLTKALSTRPNTRVLFRGRDVVVAQRPQR